MTELRSPCPRAIAVSEPSHRLDGSIVLITPTELAPERKTAYFTREGASPLGSSRPIR